MVRGQGPVRRLDSEAGQGLQEGNDVVITAVATDEDGSIESVVFAVEGQVGDGVYSDINTWTWTWTSVPAGTHEVTVTAHDNSRATASDRITIVAASAGGCTAPAWDATLTYPKGDRVQHVGILWQSKRTNTNVEPGTSPSKWTNLGPCTS